MEVQPRSCASFALGSSPISGDARVAPARSGQRHGAGDPRPASRPGLESEFASSALDAVTHVAQPVSFDVGRLEASAVVANLEAQPIGRLVEFDPDSGGAVRVLD